VSTSGDLLFLVTAAIALGAAVATVMAKKPLRAAMSLLIHIIALAGLFLTLSAHLLAALQLLVYAGAVVVLFVFVIMLLGPSAETVAKERGRVVRTASVALMAIVTAGLAFTLVGHAAPWVGVAQCAEGAECGQFGGVEGLGGTIYTQGVVPFELVSVTLLVAILGAIAVARGRSKHEVEQAREARLSREADEARRLEEEKRLSAEVSAHGGH